MHTHAFAHTQWSINKRTHTHTHTHTHIYTYVCNENKTFTHSQTYIYYIYIYIYIYICVCVCVCVFLWLFEEASSIKSPERFYRFRCRFRVHLARIISLVILRFITIYIFLSFPFSARSILLWHDAVSLLFNTDSAARFIQPMAGRATDGRRLSSTDLFDVSVILNLILFLTVRAQCP